MKSTGSCIDSGYVEAKAEQSNNRSHVVTGSVRKKGGLGMDHLIILGGLPSLELFFLVVPDWGKRGWLSLARTPVEPTTSTPRT